MNQIISPNATNLRLMLIAPFLLAALLGLALILTSLMAFGAADEFGYPSWAPVVGGLIYALPVSAGAVFFGLGVMRRTARPFRLQWLRLLGGVVCLAGVIALTASYALLVSDPSSYRGEFDPVTQKYEPLFDIKAFLWLTVLMATTFPNGGLAVAIKVLYLDAIKPAGLAAPAGSDPIGELMRRDSTPAG